MDKIVTFNSIKKFQNYFDGIDKIFIDSGTEGECYLGNDNIVYKRFFSNLDEDFLEEYYIHNIITDDEVNLKSFAFPKTLFGVDNFLVGYTARYIDNDLFKTDTWPIPQIDNIDFDKLINAYHIMKNDVIILSKMGIEIYDLPCNLIFDGERLTAIDTINYSRKEIDVRENISSLDVAIYNVFRLILLENDRNDINLSHGVEQFLKNIEKEFKPEKEKVKIKTGVYDVNPNLETSIKKTVD